MIWFPKPGDKSESMKEFASIEESTTGLTHFVKDPNAPIRSESDILDTRYYVILLVRVKFRVPAPRVWTKFEEMMHVPPYYSYYVWLDSLEKPEHYWAGEPRLDTYEPQFPII